MNQSMKKSLYSLFLVFLSLSLNQAQAQLSKYLSPKLGVVSYTFRGDFAKDLPKTLDMVKGMGIRNIEFSNLFGLSPEQIRKELDARDMICTSYGVSYEALNKKTDQVIQEAKTLGAKYVRVAWIPHKGPFDLNLAQEVVGIFNRAGEQLAKANLTFCYHNHGFEFAPYQDGTYFDYLVKATNPKYVSFELDILWAFHPGQDPAKLLEQYPKRFRLMHVKDLKKGVKGDLSGMTSPENDVVLGQGQLDLPRILKAAKKSKIEFYYLEDESSQSQIQVPQSLAFLQSLN